MTSNETHAARGRGTMVAAGSAPSSATTLGWLMVAVLGLAGFALLTVVVASGMAIPFDLQLLATARSWDAFSGLWSALSNAANLPMIVVGVGLVLWLVWRSHRREAVLVVITLAAVTAGSEAVKQLVARPRPPGSDTVVPGVVYSFPSGHVLESVTILGIIAILVWRSSLPRAVRVAVAGLVSVFVASVAVARVAINAHYPSDVLAGFLVGIGVLAIFVLLTSSRPGHEGSSSHDATA
jgi:undecaprenyl-diphosphatase